MVRLVRGARDGRLVLMVPELTGARMNSLTLLHVTLDERAEAAHLTEVLERPARDWRRSGLRSPRWTRRSPWRVSRTYRSRRCSWARWTRWSGS